MTKATQPGCFCHPMTGGQQTVRQGQTGVDQGAMRGYAVGSCEQGPGLGSAQSTGLDQVLCADAQMQVIPQYVKHAADGWMGEVEFLDRLITDLGDEMSDGLCGERHVWFAHGHCQQVARWFEGKTAMPRSVPVSQDDIGPGRHQALTEGYGIMS